MDQHDARSDEQSERLIHLPWRCGGKVGRNVYAQIAAEPSIVDIAIGHFDSALLAAEAVAAHNARLRKVS
jgi:hypothetical protein